MPRKPSTTPPPPPPANRHLKAGSPVEVSSEDPGFRGSWYTGTVKKKATKTGTKTVVQYDQIFTDDSFAERLCEELETHQVRPIAPRERERVFKNGEEVDAFYNDGWWEGTITKDMGDGKFKVYFRSTREQIVFGADKLRLHREWFRGQWNPPLEEEQEEKSPNLKPTEAETEEKPSKGTRVKKVPVTTEQKSGKTKTEEIFSQGALVEVSSDEDGFHGAWFTATIVKAVGKDKFLIEYQNLRTEDDTEFLREEADTLHIRPHPPENIMVDRFNMLEEVDAFYTDGWWVGVIAKVLSDPRYIVYFKDTNEEIEFQHSDLRLHQEWIGGKWVMASRALKL